MRVYHGTTGENASRFLAEGINAHVLHPRSIHGPQDLEPGLFVTPKLSVARRFGLFILAIEANDSNLEAPPILRQAGVDLEASLSNPLEPQALLKGHVEPEDISLVESHPNGYPFNPYEDESNQPA